MNTTNLTLYGFLHNTILARIREATPSGGCSRIIQNRQVFLPSNNDVLNIIKSLIKFRGVF